MLLDAHGQETGANRGNEVHGYQGTGANRREIDRAGLLTEHAPLTEGLHYSESDSTGTTGISPVSPILQKPAEEYRQCSGS